jgi:hypothetical protein
VILHPGQSFGHAACLSPPPATQEDPWDRWNTLLRLSNISALSRVGNTFPQPTDSTWEDTGVGLAAAITTATHTTTSGVTPSGFFSEARTSVTSLGSMSRQRILEVGACRILSRIKITIQWRPHIFVNPKGAKQTLRSLCLPRLASRWCTLSHTQEVQILKSSRSL